MTAFNRNFGGSSGGSGGNRPCQEHRAVQVAAGKALVLKDDRLLRCGIAIVGADIFAAEVDFLLRLCPDDEDTIYQIVDLLVDTCSTKRKILRIAGDDKPTEVVRSRLKKLNADHIRFVLDSLAENAAPVRNMKQYLGFIHELRLMQCYLMPDETALRGLSEGVIEKLKLLTDAEFAELEFSPD